MRATSLKIYAAIFVLAFSIAAPDCGAQAYDFAEGLKGAVHQKLIDYFQSKYSPQADAEIGIEILRFPDLSLRDEGSLRIEVQPVRKTTDFGDRIFWVEIYEGSRLETKFTISINVHVNRKVVSANQKISRGEIITADMLRLHKQGLTYNPDQVFASVDEIVGLEATALIMPGAILTRKMVRIPPTVKRGNEVNVKLIKLGIEIITTGIVLEDGVVGEQIAVKCHPEGEKLIGTVQSAKVVLVQ